jgi:hypothetical protein
LCSPPSVFIGKTEGRERQGQPMCSRPGGCILSVFLYPVEGHRSKLRQVGYFGSASFWWFWRKREWTKQGRKIFFFPCLACPGEEERLHCRSKRHRFGFSSFFNEQCMKRCRFGQNTSFYLKGKGDKKNMSEFTLVFNLWFVQLSPQLPFWFKNQCNCIPAKKQTAALKLAAFFTLILDLEFMQFDPQLINKLLISSIWPLIWFNCSPSIYACFSFWSLVLDFFN